MMSILFTDSNSDFTLEQIKQFGIEYINMPFSLLDNKVQELSVDFYEEVFTPYLEQGNNLVYVHEGSQYLASYSNLKKAVRRLKTSYPDNSIMLVDSENTSSGYAFVAYEAMLKHKTGCSDINLANHIKKFRDKVCVIFSLNNTTKLGEIGFDIKVDNPLVKPVVKLDNGNVEVIDKITNRKKLYQSIISAMDKYGQNIADYPVFISYSGAELDSNELKVEIEKYLGHSVRILINKLNEYDKYYTGNKTLVVAFHKKQD